VHDAAGGWALHTRALEITGVTGGFAWESWGITWGDGESPGDG